MGWGAGRGWGGLTGLSPAPACCSCPCRTIAIGCSTPPCLPAAAVPRPSTLAMQSLPLGHAPALAAFGGQVAALRDRAMGGYIEQQVDYFKFTRILEFSRVGFGCLLAAFAGTVCC